ncbi:MAG: lysine--tRNA ligase [Candidatus Hermodarchaeota archaeon]
MNNEFPIHWLEEIVDEISKRDVPLITLSTGKTPSGHIHLGILREILICDALRRIFKKKDKNVRFFLFIDSLDAAKRFPEYIDKEFQNKHRGKPFSFIPCPFKECKCKSYANHFGDELASTFKYFGINTEIIWTHELYKTKDMQNQIKNALENTKKIKEILKEYILPTLDDVKKVKFLEMQKTWMPAMVICEKCDKIQNIAKDGSIQPNRVLKYIKKENMVLYKCHACEHSGKLSIFSGRLKLNWRVDWPAKWSLYKTTCEPAGKDHCVKGGSYDSGLALCKEVFGYQGPIKVPYEWVRLGERDMKTSKGIVFTPKKYLEIADPEIFRMLILRTNPMKHISLRIEEIPQYSDYYEKMENIFYGEEKPNDEEEKKSFEFLYPLTKVNGVSDLKPQTIPLKVLVFFSQLQNILSIEKLYTKAKSITNDKNLENSISIEEFDFLIQRTKRWVDEVKKIIEDESDNKIKNNIKQKISLFEIPNKVDNIILNKLDSEQIKGIKLLRDFFLKTDHLDEDIIQNKIFMIAKEELKIAPKQLFVAIYQIILGKKYGPRLGSFLNLLDKEWLLERLKIEKI